MAAAKSLTPTELERVLRYIAENTNAHRNSHVDVHSCCWNACERGCRFGNW